MADYDTEKSDDKKKAKKADDDAICKQALERYQKWYAREEKNLLEAYEDLRFRAGQQWPAQVLSERTAEGRPVLTINRIPQFVRQVMGDMRQMRPSIKTVPVDSRGD